MTKKVYNILFIYTDDSAHSIMAKLDVMTIKHPIDNIGLDQQTMSTPKSHSNKS